MPINKVCTWSLLNPLVLLGVYLLVFGVIFPSKTAHYPLYVLSGLACWTFFATSLQSSARSLIDSAELVRKVRFPRQLVPFSMVGTQAVTYAVLVVVLVALLALSIAIGGRTSSAMVVSTWAAACGFIAS